MSDVTLNLSQNQPEKKDVTLLDINGTGVTVTGKSDVLTEKMELEVNLLTFGDKYEAVKSKLKDGKFTLYDPYLLNNKVEIQPNGMITVSIPVPDDYDGAKCKAFYLDESGDAVDINVIFKDGRLVFNTDHFSLCAVWQPVSVTTENPGDNSGNTSNPAEDNTQQGGQATPDHDSQGGQITKPSDNNSGTVQNPQTGDNSNIVVYFGLMMLSLAGLTVTAVRKRKEKQQ